MDDVQQSDGTKPLDRYLSPTDVWAMAFGCMVGWGVFAMPGTTFLPIAGPAGTAIAMLLGVAIMLVVGNNVSYFMGRSAITGGVYSYTKEAFGRDHAFLSSWFLCLSYLTIVFLNGTALFLVVRILFYDVVTASTHYVVAGNTIYLGETIISVVVLAGVGILFLVAKPFLQRLHTTLSVVLFAGVVTISLFCLPQAIQNGALTSFGASGVSPLYAVFSLVVLAPWAYVGFEMVAFDTAHFNFSIRHSKRVVFLSIFAAAFAYIAMALIAVAAVPDGFASWQDYVLRLDAVEGLDSVPTFFVAKSIMGPVGVGAMTVTAVAAILTGIIGGYRATTRVLSTMAEDRILSELFSRTTYSILFIMLLSIVLSLLGRNTLIWFVDLTSFGAIVGFGYTSAAAYKIAKTEGDRRTMATGVLGAIISVAFAVVQLVPRLSAFEAMGAEAFLLLSIWCLIGFIFYWRTVTKSSLTEYSGISLSGVVLFALLEYSALMWLAKTVASRRSVEDMRGWIVWGGIVVLLIIFVGLAVMLYVQNVVRAKHEAAEREKIRAVESGLAKSQFLFNMSHDIRTPMNAIIGYTNLARAETDVSTIHEYLEKIDNSNQHLLALINDVLEMSRIESGKIELEPVPTDLREVFDGINDLFADQMRRKSMNFGIHMGQVRNFCVWCDAKNLNRVLINILSNAYKFTPEEGTISMSLWEVGAGESGYGSYEIRVQDSGIGMSREFANRVFDAFERERTSTVSGVEGTGLGMSITKSLVDLMGGTIEVLTAPGAGTEIIIRVKFRLASDEDMRKAGGPEPREEQAPVDFAGKRLLLVEDNELNREIAQMILEQEGFVVENAVDGQEAVDMVAASEPGHYDAILMDIQMPVMDGYEATRAIRALANEQLASTPILAMTANAFKEDVDAAREAGMQGHIAKPVDVNVLLTTLADVLA